MRSVTLYGKPDCDLCHEARELLLRLRPEYDFLLAEVDIRQDSVLEEQYRYAIPVIVIDSDIELSAPIHERELRAALLRA